MPENVTIKFGQVGAEQIVAVFAQLRKVVENFAEYVKTNLKTSLEGVASAFRSGYATGGTFMGVLDALKVAATGPIGALTALGTLIGVFVAKAISAANSVVQWYQELRRLQSVAGGTIEEVQSLKGAIELAGLPADAMQMAMYRLGIAVETGGRELRKLGIETRTVSGEMKTPIQLFVEAHGVISRLGSESQKSAALMQLFGRAGRELGPIFKLSGEELGQLMLRARELAPIHAELARQARELMMREAELRKEQELLTAAFAKNVGIPLKEWITNVKNAMLEHLMAMKEFGPVTGTLVAALMPKAFHEMSQEEMRASAATTKLREDLETLAKTSEPALKMLVQNLLAEGKIREAMEAQRRVREIRTGPQVLSEVELRQEQEKLRFTREMDEQTLRSEAEIEGRRDRMRTGFGIGEIQKRIQVNQQLITEEEDYLTKRKKLLEQASPVGKADPVELAKAQQETDKRVFRLRQEIAKEGIQLEEEQAKSAERIQQDQTRSLRTWADARLSIIKGEAQERLATIETSSMDEEEKVKASESVKEEEVRRGAGVRIGTIEQEIGMWQQLSAQYSENAELQRRANEQIQGLSLERLKIEQDVNSQILADRRAMVEKLRQIEREKAGVGGTLEEKAIARLGQRGVKAFTQQDIQAEVQAMIGQARETTMQYGFGGAVTAEQFQQARELAGPMGRLRQLGGTPGEALYLSQQRQGAAFGMRVDVDEMISDATSGSADAIRSAFDNVEQAVKTSLENIERMVKDADIGGGMLADSISDMVIRKLEAEAARQ